MVSASLILGHVGSGVAPPPPPFLNKHCTCTCSLSNFFQNENVGRAATSERMVQDIRRKDRRTPMKVLVAKTFHFVDQIWQSYTRNGWIQGRADTMFHSTV